MMHYYVIAYVISTSFLLKGTLADSGIKGPPHITSNVDTQLSFAIGTNLKLDCPIDGYPKPWFEWLKDGETITSAWVHIRITSRGLRIKEAQKDDSGLYTCKGVNGFGSEEITLHVNVYDPSAPTTQRSQRLPAGTLGVKPSVASSSHPSTGSDGKLRRPVGSTLSLTCIAEGYPEPTILWYKDGYSLHDGRFERQGTEMKFTQLALEDSGEYTCRAFNNFGSANGTFHVQVVDRAVSGPEVLSVRTMNSTIVRGDAAIMECHVKSDVIPHIQWLKRLEDTEINDKNSSEIFKFGGVSYLLVRNIDDENGSTFTSSDGSFVHLLRLPTTSARDSGYYICLATNEQGYHYRGTVLHVLPAPLSDPLPLSVIVSLPVAVTTFLILTCLLFYHIRKKRRKRKGDSSITQDNSSTSGSVQRPQMPPPPTIVPTTIGNNVIMGGGIQIIPGDVTMQPHYVTAMSEEQHKLMTTSAPSVASFTTQPNRFYYHPREIMYVGGPAGGQQCQPLLQHVSSSDQSRNSLLTTPSRTNGEETTGSDVTSKPRTEKRKTKRKTRSTNRHRYE